MHDPNFKSDKQLARRLETHVIGSLLGCAIGDAVGEVAFRLPAKDDWQQALQREETLVYTDDTAMTIGLAETLVCCGGIEQQALGDRFAYNFMREAWRGYGPGPPEVLTLGRKYERTYVEIARALYSGDGSFGNGAAMRAAPLGLAYRDGEALRDAAERAAEVTHAHPVGQGMHVWSRHLLSASRCVMRLTLKTSNRWQLHDVFRKPVERPKCRQRCVQWLTY